MHIVTVPCLADNYAYLVVCPETSLSAVVDVSEFAPVEKACLRENITPNAIFSTHHHADHVGGNVELAARFGIDAVYAHASDRGRVPGQTKELADGDSFRLGSLSVSVIHIPGHTLGAVAYWVRAPSGEGAVFTGDTMFIAGCGRLFEGTPAQMFASLQRLVALPDATRVYCGHEYTESNLRFALHVEPDNADVASAMTEARATRSSGRPTVPSTIAREKACNPFVRVRSATIRRQLGLALDDEPASVLAAVRRAKDSFR